VVFAQPADRVFPVYVQRRVLGAEHLEDRRRTLRRVVGLLADVRCRVGVGSEPL